MTATALAPELLELMDHEKGIEHSVAEVGWHLTCIRDARLYRAASFATFEDYCLKRWGWRRTHADRMIAAAEVIEQLSAPEITPMGVSRPPEVVPTSERQVRPLTPLRDNPDALRAAWDQAVEDANGEQPTAEEVRRAARRVRNPKPVSKPDVGTGVAHPAAYSEPLLPVFADLLKGYRRVLDPFAGTGKIHRLRELAGIETVGVEIEPEWAACHPDTIVGNALDLRFDDNEFDAICTSPTYGNRLADSHNAYDAESRHSYTHDLGRKLDKDNSGDLHWGPDYKRFHETAWREALRVLRPGGRFVLNIKDHIRGGEIQPVTLWHVTTLVRLGLSYVDAESVDTRNLRSGANADLRCPEWVIALDKAE